MVATPTQAATTVPGSRPLTALEEAVMATCWAAGEPLTPMIHADGSLLGLAAWSCNGS